MDEGINQFLATEDDKARYSRVGKAYAKLQAGEPLSIEEAKDFNDFVKTVKDLSKAKQQATSFQDTIGSMKFSAYEMPEQDMFMASLIKDTPKGQYDINLAKEEAANHVKKSNYTSAFKRLQAAAAQNFEHVFNEAPELAQPDTVGAATKYFKVLNNYAPSMAADPVVASSFIKKVMSYGGLDEKLVQSLIQINNEHMKHHENMHHD